MEPAQESISYRWPTKILDTGHNDDLVWWLVLDGIPAKIWVGMASPDVSPGDLVEVTIRKRTP